MDIERLHRNYLCKSGRGVGKTYDQLVEAVHQAGSVPTVTYVVAYAREIGRLSDLFIEIAKDVGYVCRRRRHDMVRITTPEGATDYRFVLRSTNTHGAQLVLSDHFAEEFCAARHSESGATRRHRPSSPAWRPSP